MKPFAFRSAYRNWCFSVPRTADYQFKATLSKGQRPVRIRYWPAYTNPYQRLFYGHPNSDFAAQAGSIDVALEDLRNTPGHQVCFHLHWLNFLFRDGSPSNTVASAADRLIADMKTFKSEGGSIIWTIHNLVEHDSASPDQEIAFRRKLCSLADVVLVHGETAASLVTQQLPESSAKIVMVPHGNYIGIYEDSVSQAEARRLIQAPQSGTVFGNVGRLRRYKGTEKLVSAVREVNASGYSAGLILAGEALGSERKYIRSLASSEDWLRVFPSYIHDKKIQVYMNACDFIVLPYAAILTSGSAILALSFGRPVIAPRLGGLPDIIEDGYNGLLYDADGAPDAALRRACEMSAQGRSEMAQAALKSAAGLLWSEGRTELFHKLSGHTQDPAAKASQD